MLTLLPPQVVELITTLHATTGWAYVTGACQKVRRNAVDRIRCISAIIPTSAPHTVLEQLCITKHNVETFILVYMDKLYTVKYIGQ